LDNVQLLDENEPEPFLANVTGPVGTIAVPRSLSDTSAVQDVVLPAPSSCGEQVSDVLVERLLTVHVNDVLPEVEASVTVTSTV